MKNSIQFSICCCEIQPVFLPMKTRCLAALKLSDTGLSGAWMVFVPPGLSSPPRLLRPESHTMYRLTLFQTQLFGFPPKTGSVWLHSPPHVSSLRWILAILPSAKQSDEKNLRVFYFWVFQSSVGGTFNGDRISFGDNKLLLSCMVPLCSQVNCNGVHFTKHLT